MALDPLNGGLAPIGGAVLPALGGVRLAVSIRRCARWSPLRQPQCCPHIAVRFRPWAAVAVRPDAALVVGHPDAGRGVSAMADGRGEVEPPAPVLAGRVARAKGGCAIVGKGHESIF